MKHFSQITIDTGEGKQKFDVLLNFYSDQFNRHYMVVCESGKEAVNGQISVMPLMYEADKDGNVTDVAEIETREEFELVKRKFEESLDHFHEHDEDCGCRHDHDHHHDEHDCHCHHHE